MTITILFWVRLIVWIVIAYSILTIGRTIFQSRKNNIIISKLLRSVFSDVISIAIGFFALYIIEKNYQQPFDKVMQSQSNVFPSFRYIETSTGSEHAIENTLGALTIVNYWATWCGPCRKELPDLDSVQKKYASRGLKIIAVSDEDLQTVQQYLQNKNFSFTGGAVTVSNITLDGINTRPVSIFLDKNGKVIDMMVGSRGFGFFDKWVKNNL